MFFQGPMALISGASSSFGSGIAEAMARQGARVRVNYCKNPVGADQAAGAIRQAESEALGVRADDTRHAEVLALVDTVRSE